MNNYMIINVSKLLHVIILSLLDVTQKSRKSRKDYMFFWGFRFGFRFGYRFRSLQAFSIWQVWVLVWRS